MRRSHWILRSLLLVALIGLWGASNASAQDTIGASGVSGVSIDAKGELRREMLNDPTGELLRKRVAEAQIAINGQQAGKQSELRKVSLNRLEAALGTTLANNQRPTSEMLHLAGLTRVKYVFYYPETKDIVLAGPAEPWGELPFGRVVGLKSGWPTMMLEDLIVALRAYPPSGQNAGQVGCSIDPTPEGLARLQQFLGQLGGQATPNQTQFIVDGLQKSLGPQVISVQGISPKTHMALVMVEADYRMKLIGIGLEKAPVKLTSYVERVNPSSVAKNALQRWYFVPNYQCIRVAQGGGAMELVGEGVKLIGEEEFVAVDGDRKGTGGQNGASAAFTKNFTDSYPELAKKSPVYAQLRNCIDLLVAAAYIQNEDMYDKSGWKLGSFNDEEKYPVAHYNAPQQVEAAVNSIWKGRRLMTPIGGGVAIHAEQALESKNILTDDDGHVQKAHAAIELSKLPANQWWWD